MTSQIIVCSNKKSINYQGLNTRDKDNAKWTNNVNVDFIQGDQISLQNAVLNLRGASSDSTIEILGENDPVSNLADSKIGFRFVPYLNDNARANTVALPFTASTNTVKLGTSEDEILYYQDGTICFPNVDFLDGFTLIKPTIYDTITNNELIYNSGEMHTDIFKFSGEYTQNGDIGCSPAGNNVKTLYTKSGTKASTYGTKYVVLDDKYRGPYKSNNSGGFNSGEDDCKPLNFDIKIDLGATYGAPSTIANTIDDILNTTNNYGDNETQPYVAGDYQDRILLPSFTGTLLKNKVVNGIHTDLTNDAGLEGLYGNIAVENISEWRGLHYMFRTDLSFEGKVGFNSDNDFVKFNRPVFLLPEGFMFVNDQSTKNNEEPFYPRVKYTMNYTWVKRDGTDLTPHAKSLDFFYSTLPENFLMITNMTYNENNVRLLSKYQKEKEFYDGIYNDGDINQATDINNYRFHLDLGESRQGVQEGAADIYSRTRTMYHMSQGNVDIIQFDPDAPTFRRPTAYAYSLPFEPFEDKITSSFKNAFSTNRSDIPNLGYVQNFDSELYWVPGDLMPFRGSVKTITQDVPHRFADNVASNCSVAVKSKYMSNWRDIMKTANYSTDDNNLSDLYEGNGTYFTEWFNELPTDDTLSQQYNIGVYPVSIRPNRSTEAYYNLMDSYWVGLMENLNINVQNQKYSFLFRIIDGVDEDHKQHGGYSFQQWVGGTDGWLTLPDMYIYTSNNTSVANGRNTLTGLTFQGNDLRDLDTEGAKWVVFDYANDQRFVGVCNTDGDNLKVLSMSMDVAEPGFKTVNNPTFPDEDPRDFYPLGFYPSGSGGHLYEFQITTLGVISLDPNSKYYWKNTHTPPNVQEPTGINEIQPPVVHPTNNAPEVVCAFLLYRDSATQDANGTWTISKDYALPAIHTGQFCNSGSFLDHPALWLLNGEMYDAETDLSKQTPENTLNYISIGVNNPTFSFENSVARFAFSNLHNPLILGIQDMPFVEETATYDTANLGKVVVKVNDDKIQRGWLYTMLDTWRIPAQDNENKGGFTGWGSFNRNFGLCYSDGGVYIDSAYTESISNNSATFDDMVLLTQYNWTGCLFWKLGFTYFDLFPSYGSSSHLYDSSKLSSFSSTKRYDNLKPYTTNPKIDINMGVSLAVQDYSNKNSAGVGEPTFSRSLGSLQDVNLDASISEFIYASNLAIKNNDGFFMVYTNLSSSNYIQNESTFNIIGSIFRNYTTGDYIYSFATPPTVVNFTGKITQIDIEIRDSNGNIVALNDDNSILLLHNKTGAQQLMQLALQIQQEQKGAKK